MIKVLTVLLILALPSQALAMHISEGILPMKWAGLWFALMLPFFVYALKLIKIRAKDDISFKPLLGLVAAVVFIISAMPIPVPLVGTCSHPSGTGISAILLGPFISSLVATVALLMQALFMAHGGLSTLGANVVSMGIVGSFAGYAAFRLTRKTGAGLMVSGFMAGLMADWATYIATAAELALGIKGEEPFMAMFMKILIAFMPTQLPLGIIEGAMTAGIVVLLHKKRPDILRRMGLLKKAEVPA